MVPLICCPSSLSFPSKVRCIPRNLEMERRAGDGGHRYRYPGRALIDAVERRAPFALVVFNDMQAHPQFHRAGFERSLPRPFHARQGALLCPQSAGQRRQAHDLFPHDSILADSGMDVQ